MRHGALVIVLALVAVVAGQETPRLGIVPDYANAEGAAGVLIAEVVAESPGA